jgi:hypothetical protein
LAITTIEDLKLRGSYILNVHRAGVAAESYTAKRKKTYLGVLSATAQLIQVTAGRTLAALVLVELASSKEKELNTNRQRQESYNRFQGKPEKIW